jgi:hypothetical protein
MAPAECVDSTQREPPDAVSRLTFPDGIFIAVQRGLRYHDKVSPDFRRPPPRAPQRPRAAQEFRPNRPSHEARKSP